MAETKDQFLWAIVKGLGIYFFARGVLWFIPVVTPMIWDQTILRSGWVRQSPAPWGILFASLLEVGFGAYLLLDGSWLIRLANRTGIPDVEAAENAGDENSGAAGS